MGKIDALLCKAVASQYDERQHGHMMSDDDGRLERELVLRFSKEDGQALLDELGIKLTPVVSLGTCDTCKHSNAGRERGYQGACLKCVRPRHDLYVPLFGPKVLAMVEAARELAIAEHTKEMKGDFVRQHSWIIMTGRVTGHMRFWCNQCGWEITIMDEQAKAELAK